jgi:hypothetical protein
VLQLDAKNPQRDAVPRKGEGCTRIWQQTRRRLLAVVAVALASCAIPCEAQKKAPAPAAAPAPDATDRAVKGPVVSYEERKQAGIVYLEESGGMTVATPPAPPREEAPRAARLEGKSPEERSISTGTGTGIGTRRVAK